MADTMNLPKLFTRQQAADYLRVSLVTLDKMIREKALNAVKRGRYIRVGGDDLLAFIDDNSTIVGDVNG